MSTFKWPEKAPGATADFTLPLANQLEGDTILSVAWSVPAGLTSSAPSNTADSVTIWLSGGTVGQRYTIGFTVTTTGGRVLPYSVTIYVANL